MDLEGTREIGKIEKSALKVFRNRSRTGVRGQRGLAAGWGRQVKMCAFPNASVITARAPKAADRSTTVVKQRKIVFRPQQLLSGDGSAPMPLFVQVCNNFIASKHRACMSENVFFNKNDEICHTNAQKHVQRTSLLR